MTGPIDAITAIHNAFRKDMEGIDAAALSAARCEPGLEAALERFRFCNEVLVVHARGEEIGVFPLLRRSHHWSPRPMRRTIAVSTKRSMP